MNSRRKETIKICVLYFLATVFMLYAIFPIIWIIAGSLRTSWQNAQIPPVWIFWPRFDNYQNVWGEAVLHLRDSLIVSSIPVLLAFALGFPAAYALARLDIKNKGSILIWIISLRMAPTFAFVVPFFTIMKNLQLIDTYTGLIIVYLLLDLPFVIWILKGFIEGLPQAMEESAMIDGCTRLAALWRITLPLIAPGVVITLVLTLIFSWNEFLFASVFASSNVVTMPVVIARRQMTMFLNWEEMCALSVLTILPVVILTIAVRKYLVKGLTLGAVKG